jgi:hypothetical protein
MPQGKRLLKNFESYSFGSIVKEELFLTEIISNLLNPIPEVEGHYLKFSEAVLKSSDLKFIGWFERMKASVLKFL